MAEDGFKRKLTTLAFKVDAAERDRIMRKGPEDLHDQNDES